MLLSSNTDVLSNVAVGNAAYGFAIDKATGITLRHNTATGNARAGIEMYTSVADLEITKNNIFGNGVAAM